MSNSFQIITPIDGSVYAERALHTYEQAQHAANEAREAQRGWARLSIEERAVYMRRFLDCFLAKSDLIAEELTWQIGRPISQSPGELRGFADRARYMIDCASEALAPVVPSPIESLTRSVNRVPLGVVLNLPAWNYPLLTAVNAFVPALMAGNAVLFKHSSQTAICGDRIAAAFEEAGLPDGLFGHLYLDHATTERLIASPAVDFVCFTGSVKGGHAVTRAASERFIGMGLELGGKDAAYVRHDANLAHAVENLVDGAMFNSGQSCCGIERIYVHESLFDDFVEGAVMLASQYRLGDPRDPNTNLGPLVRTSAAQSVRDQIEQARRMGAHLHVTPEQFGYDDPATAYLAPQILTNVTHEMDIMREETFGPAVGIMKVSSDEEAIRLINDSPYGLTSAIWTQDQDVASVIAPQLEVGTVFMNRCDYLDPALAWVGVKDSGRGCTLSKVGYESLTRPQSLHFRTLS